jgi:1-acyl-sn-glycerol-3-phosphate acyltransferase
VKALRALWRCLRAALHVLHGMLIVASRFPRLDRDQRMQQVQWWSAKYLRVLGVRLVVEGQAIDGAKLVVANHVSWLDILALNAVTPMRFVSKSEIRDWPLLGWMVSAAGTLFIERGRPRDAHRVVHQMAEALQRGDTLGIFPEGTTSPGHGLLPFHANLLQAAVATNTVVQPLALRYSDDAHPISRAAPYVGETSLFESLAAVLMADGLVARVVCLPPQRPPHQDRRALSAQLAASIAAALV